MTRTPARRIFAVLLALTATHVAAAEPSTVPATASSAIDVREWVVFDVSVTQSTANDRDAWPSTLPPFVTSRRATAGADDDNRPLPIGVIRLYGTLDAATPTDVLLNLPGGDTQATWPRAQVKSNRILWPNLMPADGQSAPAALDPPHWMTPLRGGDAAVFRADRQVDSMLVYDVSLKYAPPLRVKAQNGVTTAENTGPAPMHGLTLYKPQKDGQWTRAALPVLTGREPPKPAAATRPDAAAAFDTPTTRPTTAAAATAPSTTPAVATTAPATQPQEAGTAVAFDTVAAGSADALLAAWKPALLDAGVPATDVETVLNILAARVAGDRWMTAVYRLDPAELDRLLPLEVVPTPRQTRRVGLVVVHGIDPAIVEEVDRLIAQCGDADYARRKVATDQLIAIGKPAKAKLEKAQSHRDVEISQRAEFILSAIENQKKN